MFLERWCSGFDALTARWHSPVLSEVVLSADRHGSMDTPTAAMPSEPNHPGPIDWADADDAQMRTLLLLVDEIATIRKTLSE
jgi:hypothetical protein